jgi:hypothetical protein
MPFNQDDEREQAMVNALNLQQRPGRARHEEDGHLDWPLGDPAYRLLFECKSAPEGDDWGTGRDTGLSKLQEWSTFHFVLAVFESRGRTPIKMWYGSPRMMRDWINGEIAYIQADLVLARLIPTKVDDDAVNILFGDKEEISYQEMYAVMKNEWYAKKAKGLPNRYDQYADLHRGKTSRDHVYSRQAGLQAAKDRITYLLNRGVTVNNRHISRRYVAEHCAELNPTAWFRSFEATVARELELEPPSAAQKIT